MTRLEGKNLFEWRAEYADLVTQFVTYADHTTVCGSRAHKHDTRTDDRIVCRAAPCTCGLLVVLSVLNPTITYGIECPDEPQPKPTQAPIMLVPTRRVLQVHPDDIRQIPTVTVTDADTGIEYSRADAEVTQRIVGQIWGIPAVEYETLPEGVVRLMDGSTRRIDMPETTDNGY